MEAEKTQFFCGCGGGCSTAVETWYCKIFVNLIGFEKVCGFCINRFTCCYQTHRHWEWCYIVFSDDICYSPSLHLSSYIRCCLTPIATKILTEKICANVNISIICILQTVVFSELSKWISFTARNVQKPMSKMRHFFFWLCGLCRANAVFGQLKEDG